MTDFTGRDLLIGGTAVSPTATLPAVPLMADTIRSETPFPRLELWEDGRRIPELYQPENFEWWYFDAQLTDGRTLVLSSISTRTPSSAGSCIEPRPRSQAQMDSASLPHTSITRR